MSTKPEDLEESLKTRRLVRKTIIVLIKLTTTLKNNLHVFEKSEENLHILNNHVNQISVLYNCCFTLLSRNYKLLRRHIPKLTVLNNKLVHLKSQGGRIEHYIKIQKIRGEYKKHHQSN